MDIENVKQSLVKAYNLLHDIKYIPEAYHDYLTINWDTIIHFHNKTVKSNKYNNTSMGIMIHNEMALVQIIYFVESHRERLILQKFSKMVCDANDESYKKTGKVPFIALSININDQVIFLPYDFHSIKSKPDILTYCINCMKDSKEIKLQSCSKCHLAQYCSVDCQRKNWKEHKELCSLWSLKK